MEAEDIKSELNWINERLYQLQRSHEDELNKYYDEDNNAGDPDLAPIGALAFAAKHIDWAITRLDEYKKTTTPHDQGGGNGNT